jgi:hypothetical protein
MTSEQDNALAIYLEDHLAGSVQAVELIDNIREDHRHEELGKFATQLIEEVKADQETLRGIADRVGTGASRLKDSTAWVAEKLTLIKLHRKSNSGLGDVEALEFLELGIQGKWALWRALGEIASSNGGLAGIDFRELEKRASTQNEKVEEQRLRLVRKTFVESSVSDTA